MQFQMKKTDVQIQMMSVVGLSGVRSDVNSSGEVGLSVDAFVGDRCGASEILRGCSSVNAQVFRFQVHSNLKQFHFICIQNHVCRAVYINLSIYSNKVFLAA